MQVSFNIPEGYLLAGLTQEGMGTYWMAYLRKVEKAGRIGAFAGSKGRTAQEAIDKTFEYLESRQDQYADAYLMAMNEDLTSDDLEL